MTAPKSVEPLNRTDTRRVRFNKRTVAAMPVPDSGRLYTYDTETPGLAVCVTSKGRRTFYVVRRISHRSEKIRLGRFGDMTVAQARQQAMEIAGEIARDIDPNANRKAERNAPTLGELFDWWLETYAKPHKKTWPEDVRKFNQFFSTWRTRRLSEITRRDIQTLHAKIGRKNGTYAANRVLSLIKTVLGAAEDFGWPGDNPARKVKKFKEEDRDRFLQADELPRFFRALAAEENTTIRDFFLMALLTGARTGNVASIKWVDVDLDRAVWRMPDTKHGVVVIPLVAPAVELLEGREEVAGDSPYVFPGHGAKGHIVGYRKVWSRITERAGIEDLRPHDLRRSLGSWQAITGASLPIIGRSLGHKSLDATAIYARLQLDPVRESVERATVAMFKAGQVQIEGPNDEK